MTLVSRALQALAPRQAVGGGPVSVSVPPWQAGIPLAASGNYQSYAREGYQGNEIIYSAIELRATSAAEPHVIGRRKVKESTRGRLRSELASAGVSALQVDYLLRTYALTEDVTEHPAIEVLNRPNPFMSRFQFWATIIMHRDLAGNAYAWKGRDENGKWVESWILRPDRVNVIPDRQRFIRGYRYQIGGEFIDIPVADIMHFKTRDPFNAYYGMPPLMPVSGRVDLDNYQRDFVAAFFRNGGNPGAVLSVKQRLTQDAKDEIRTRYRTQFGGSAGWFQLMVLDGAETSFTPVTAQFGQRGMILPELDKISEARLAMVFGIPGSILGLLIGYESSSYANKRQDWQVLWDVTLTPLYVDLGDTLDLSLLPEYPDLDEFLFDLTEVKALQEDVDKVHDRERKDLLAGGITVEEFRAKTGRSPEAAGGVYLIPGNYTATPAEKLGEMPAPAEPAAVVGQMIAAMLVARAPEPPALPEAAARVEEARCPACNKLCGRDVLAGEKVFCRRCKAEFTAGAVEVLGLTGDESSL